MKNLYSLHLIVVFLLGSLFFSFSGDEGKSVSEGHQFNRSYSGKNLDRVAFPIGGLGAGMFCMEGTGSISHLSVNNKPEIYNEPFAFATISVKGIENGTKVLEAQVPTWKLFGSGGTGNGSGEHDYGLPRFTSAKFIARFPFATLNVEDIYIPVQVEILGWSPFIPTDMDNSGLPSGAMEYMFKNTSPNAIDAVFSYNAKNFLDKDGRILKAHNGFSMISDNKDNSQVTETGFSIFVDDNNAVVDYCWFRGGWFDPLTILWKNLSSRTMVNNPPVEGSSPGATIAVPISLKPGEEKTIIVNFCWYLPDTKLTAGAPLNGGVAFKKKPSNGKVASQQTVSGFIGSQLVNTFDPAGDGQIGVSAKNLEIVNRLHTELFDYLKKVDARFPKKDPEYNAQSEKEYEQNIVNKLCPSLENQRKKCYPMTLIPKTIGGEAKSPKIDT